MYTRFHAFKFSSLLIEYPFDLNSASSTDVEINLTIEIKATYVNQRQIAELTENFPLFRTYCGTGRKFWLQGKRINAIESTPVMANQMSSEVRRHEADTSTGRRVLKDTPVEVAANTLVHMSAANILMHMSAEDNRQRVEAILQRAEEEAPWILIQARYGSISAAKLVEMHNALVQMQQLVDAKGGGTSNPMHDTRERTQSPWPQTRASTGGHSRRQVGTPRSPQSQSPLTIGQAMLEVAEHSGNLQPSLAYVRRGLRKDPDDPGHQRLWARLHGMRWNYQEWKEEIPPFAPVPGFGEDYTLGCLKIEGEDFEKLKPSEKKAVLARNEAARRLVRASEQKLASDLQSAREPEPAIAVVEEPLSLEDSPNPEGISLSSVPSSSTSAGPSSSTSAGPSSLTSAGPSTLPSSADAISSQSSNNSVEVSSGSKRAKRKTRKYLEAEESNMDVDRVLKRARRTS
ncbi:hypothetical protein K505DRAFT_340622 [Melanomma pulvis-pyrius CBS 109.77]|uniref:Uncharacterized protein n=1 Tax=Melanomma pulvis-pyrius CBS 109.77 TaxID=1314802 RepID=A0A6A6X2S6_9PLEO|nr:hypothetical protein K505DRAFT_340622 [Melanomma pulvis-pyrius CBS 109.77]